VQLWITVLERVVGVQRQSLYSGGNGKAKTT
jgi:hypothetical protein